MKTLFTLLTISLLNVISFAQVQKKNHVTIIKIDTTITGQVDTLIFNFEGDQIGNMEEIMKNIPGFDMSIIDSSFHMSIMDSTFNFGFEKDFQMPEGMAFGMPNEMLFGFGAPDNSAKIGITPARSFKGEGVMIETVVPTSLGAALGLQTGDVIVELNKQAIHNFDELVGTLQQYSVGDEANITFLRNGKKKKVTGYFIPAQGGNNMQREIRIQRP
ncbi:MAG: peptidase and chymotrypsin/Hap [Bacteroidota bacterium]|jgi:membrane-associated protease RseP (regulator of RpoE activity)